MATDLEEDSNLENFGLFGDFAAEEADPSLEMKMVDYDEPKKPKLFPIFDKNFKPTLLKSVQLEVEKSTPVKRKRTMLTKDPAGITQMVLDAGQKQIGPKYCGECGLLYSPGDFEDEEEHHKAHVRIQNTFKLTLWKDTRILFNYPDDGCQIIMVQCGSDSQRVKNRLTDFLAWLDSELGAGYDPSGRKPSERIFLYTSRTTRKNVVRILGCGIMEILDPSKIATCKLVRELSQSSPISIDTLSPSSSTSTASTSSLTASERDNKPKGPKIMIGIARLWTDPGFRKKHIASRICDTMRFNSGILGCVVPKEKIGILEPSDAGHAFMTKYTDSQGASYSYK